MLTFSRYKNKTMTNVRKTTNKLLDALAHGVVDQNTVVNACLSYMSEADVTDMVRINELLLHDDDIEFDDDDALFCATEGF